METMDGYGQTKKVTEIRDYPYDRYPREFIEPPSVELKIAKKKIVSPIFSYPKDERSEFCLTLGIYKVFL